MLIISGLHDLNGLGIYLSDEYDQFPHVLRMIRPGATFRETVSNILVYRHWQFGYPFFFSSAAAILPLKLGLTLIGNININTTTAYVLILRQLSPLFIIISVMLLIYMWTEFRYPLRSAVLFIFLSAVPCVFGNNMWWHPDSLVTLFVVLTIYALYKDSFQFGPWFYGAALFCGLATGTKVIGVYFFLTIAVYLFSGWAMQKLRFIRMLTLGFSFCIIIISTVIFTNPLLLIPNFSKVIFDSLAFHAGMQKLGWGVQMERGALLWYTENLRHSFGFWWIYAVCLCCIIIGVLFDARKRLLNVIIITWAIPFSVYLLFFVANKSGRYFIPILLPFLSCIGNPAVWGFKNTLSPRRRGIAVFFISMIALCSIQYVFYIQTNSETYIQALDKEKNSQAMAFYHQLNERVLSKIPEGKKLKVLRNLLVYLPPSKNIEELVIRRAVIYEYVDAFRPDLILFLKLKRTAPRINNEFAKKNTKFFHDVENNAVPGYHLVLNTEFGFALMKNG